LSLECLRFLERAIMVVFKLIYALPRCIYH
jgi:hypothetical protein